MEVPPVTADTPVPPYEQWPSLPSHTEYTGDSTPNPPREQKNNAMELDRTAGSMEYDEKSPLAFSMDDLEVAKALTGLREASPAHSITTVASRTITEPQSPRQSHREEPLLSLLTSQHPLVARAIDNSLSAYSSSKSYSPRFRQGAEYVERNIASPIANTVNTAGRISGVETGVRWWLQRNDSNNGGSSSTEHEPSSHKRRRLGSMEMDIERGPDSSFDPVLPHRSRALSDMSQFSQPESLPPYDENRSPVYEEHALVPSEMEKRPREKSGLLSQKWQTRLMLSTSGLGVAMSDDSLRSLKYCLSWLRWANTHLSRVLANLQAVLYEWEQSQQQLDDSSSFASTSAPSSPLLSPSFPPSLASSTTFSAETRHRQMQLPPRPRDPALITANIAALKGECLKTLKGAIDVVSTYAGGALPENARILVKRHLTSLPLRFRLTSSSTSNDNNDSSGNSNSSNGNGNGNAAGASQIKDVVASNSAIQPRNVSEHESAIDNGGNRSNPNGQTHLPKSPTLRSPIDGSNKEPSTLGAPSEATSRSGSLDAESQASRSPEVVSGAKRVAILAREGLDMMSQVSAVVDGTIVSAEEWCERLGRKRARNNSSAGDGRESGRERATDVKDANGFNGASGNTTTEIDEERVKQMGAMRMDDRESSVAEARTREEAEAQA